MIIYTVLDHVKLLSTILSSIAGPINEFSLYNNNTSAVAVGSAVITFHSLSLPYRYANRAKNIKNKPMINEDPKDALLREFQEELVRYVWLAILHWWLWAVVG